MQNEQEGGDLDRDRALKLALTSPRPAWVRVFNRSERYFVFMFILYDVVKLFGKLYFLGGGKNCIFGKMS